MLRKIIRLLLTLFGAALGCAVCRIAGYFVERSREDIVGMFTDVQIMGIYITFAIIFGFIFFRLTPLLLRQSNKVANNIEKDLRGVSGSKIFAGVAGLIAGLVIAFFISQMFRFIQDDLLYSIISIVIYVFLGYLGFVVATSKRNELFPMLSAPHEQEGSGPVRVVSGRRKKQDTIPKILDTSVIIAGVRPGGAAAYCRFLGLSEEDPGQTWPGHPEEDTGRVWRGDLQHGRREIPEGDS